MAMDHTAAVERFSGFAHAYDQYRPAPPDDFGPLLTQLAQMEHPGLVIDIGCGTGLSTRCWAGRAARVIGVEPSPEMIAEARAQTPQPNVSYLEGLGHRVALPDRCADIVTCCDALHWMEPGPTLAEVVRLLRPGGAFAWLHYSDEPLLTPWQLDQAHRSFLHQSRVLDAAHAVTAPALRWTKGEYASLIDASFRHAHEFHLHQARSTAVDQYLGWVLTLGHVQGLLKRGVSTEAMGLDRLQASARRILAGKTCAWYWSAEVRVAVL